MEGGKGDGEGQTHRVQMAFKVRASKSRRMPLPGRLLFRAFQNESPVIGTAWSTRHQHCKLIAFLAEAI